MKDQLDSKRYDWMNLTAEEIYEKVTQDDQDSVSTLLENGIANELWAGEISVGTYCRHLEYLLSDSEDKDIETVIYRRDNPQDDGSINSNDDTEVYQYNSDTDEKEDRIEIRSGALKDNQLRPDPIGAHRTLEDISRTYMKELPHILEMPYKRGAEQQDEQLQGWQKRAIIKRDDR